MSNNVKVKADLTIELNKQSKERTIIYQVSKTVISSSTLHNGLCFAINILHCEPAGSILQYAENTFLLHSGLVYKSIEKKMRFSSVSNIF